jgi:hypothetical protein
VNTLLSAASMKVLMKELKGIVMVATTTLILKDLLSTVVLAPQFFVRQDFVGLTNVVKHFLGLFLVFFRYLVGMILESEFSRERS